MASRVLRDLGQGLDLQKDTKIEAIEVTLLLKCIRGVVSADRVLLFKSFE